MADVQGLSHVKATLRCPDCASPRIRREAVVESSKMWKLLERCGDCQWERKPQWVKV